MSRIDPSIETFAAVRVPLGIGKKDDFALKPLGRFLRNAIGEVIGDVLQCAGRIKVRQVAAAVPTGIAGIAIRLNGGVSRADQAIGVPGKSGFSDLYGRPPKNKKPRLRQSGRTFLQKIA